MQKHKPFTKLLSTRAVENKRINFESSQTSKKDTDIFNKINQIFSSKQSLVKKFEG